MSLQQQVLVTVFVPSNGAWILQVPYVHHFHRFERNKYILAFY